MKKNGHKTRRTRKNRFYLHEHIKRKEKFMDVKWKYPTCKSASRRKTKSKKTAEEILNGRKNDENKQPNNKE